MVSAPPAGAVMLAVLHVEGCSPQRGACPLSAALLQRPQVGEARCAAPLAGLRRLRVRGGGGVAADQQERARAQGGALLQTWRCGGFGADGLALARGSMARVTTEALAACKHVPPHPTDPSAGGFIHRCEAQAGCGPCQASRPQPRHSASCSSVPLLVAPTHPPTPTPYFTDPHQCPAFPSSVL